MDVWISLNFVLYITAICCEINVKSPSQSRIHRAVGRRRREILRTKFAIHKTHPKSETVFQRHKRSIVNAHSTEVHNVSATEFAIDMSKCGVNKSCVRIGVPKCAFGECDYIITYRRIRKDYIQIEMAARTSGWVAIGLSSDQKMGGNSVLACVRHHDAPFVVRSESYYNPFNYNPPIHRPESVLNLTDYSYANGYLSCRVERGLTDSLVDLTNDWYQFYAYGPSSFDGKLSRHEITPRVSRVHRSLVSKMADIMIDGSPIVTSSFCVFVTTLISVSFKYL